MSGMFTHFLLHITIVSIILTQKNKNYLIEIIKLDKKLFNYFLLICTGLGMTTFLSKPLIPWWNKTGYENKVNKLFAIKDILV